MIPGINITTSASPRQAELDRRDEAHSMLSQWWHDMADKEVEAVVPKAIEYGSDDLTEIGTLLARHMGREVEADEAAELGIYFYMLGKMARWTAAVREGRRVSDDTILDIGIYDRMVQRIREVGAWPGV
jgi:hypothetical protein